MRMPVGILVIACLVVGIVPAVTIGPVLGTAVRSVLGANTPHYSLAIWHGFNQPLLMSVIALGSGALFYLLFRKGLNRRAGPPVIGRFKGGRMFERTLAELILKTRALEKLIATRRLQPQMRLLVVIACVAGLLPFLRLGYSFGSLPGTPLDPAFGVIWLVGGACAIGAAYLAKYHRLAALVLMAGAGLVACISFIWLSAPDLAVTQLLVETVTTVLLLLGLRWLPKRAEEVWPDDRVPVRVTFRRSMDLVIAIAAGTGVALVAYAMMTRPLADTISRFFVERAYSEGGGTNVVNVILVDFRAFDTLGEITVLAIAGLTIFSLLRRFRPARDSVDAPVQQRVQNAFDHHTDDRKVGDTKKDYLLVPRVIMEWLFPVIVVFAIYLLLRGHDLPGGGFAGGITMSIAIVLQYMAGGTRVVEAQLRVRPLRWIGVGLLFAVCTGAGALVFGYPFLSSSFEYLELPLFGAVPLASALLFDLGVFGLVVGATALILVAIAHQSIRTPRARLPARQELAPMLSEAREG
jgi:multicomponent K+:H+ antiporter subunit A